ncbi:MAG: hypothetical protein ACK4UO_12105 [Pseudolabrys sp.]
MKAMLTIVSALTANAAQAHDAMVPHAHPHAPSWLPSTETVGVAALVLALAVIVYTQFRRG